eukprot:487698-Alexandrium_andersonii.AAC.1
MGGTPSPLLWAIAYDPIISAVAASTGCVMHTFVDDMSAKARGPSQTMATELALVAASAVTGLQVDGHG